MKASTVEALDRINRDFYRRSASEFSRTRKRGWPGWEELFERIASETPLDRQRLSILDLGCGNGRVLPVLVERLGDRISYLGLDASLALLFDGRRLAGATVPGARFSAADLVRTRLEAVESARRFDLILAFGLMHHVPSRRLRAELLESAAGRLRPGGLLSVSFWQFGRRQRFVRRFVAWDDLPAELGRVETSDLEEGDHLLAWGDAGAVRYCHHAGPAEADELVEKTGLDSMTSFHADGASGDFNLYYLLRKR